MSRRQLLKKRIYKAKKNNKDFLELQLELDNLKLSNKQLIQQKQIESSEIIRKLELSNYSLISLNQYMPRINELSKEIQKINNLEYSEKWRLPYHIKKILSERSFYAFDNLEKLLSKTEPSDIKILNNDKKTRYILLLVDGIKLRINVLTKKQFISKNYYWFINQKCSKTYKNCLKLIY